MNTWLPRDMIRELRTHEIDATLEEPGYFRVQKKGGDVITVGLIDGQWRLEVHTSDGLLIRSVVIPDDFGDIVEGIIREFSRPC